MSERLILLRDNVSLRSEYAEAGVGDEGVEEEEGKAKLRRVWDVCWREGDETGTVVVLVAGKVLNWVASICPYVGFDRGCIGD